jgi:di/tricarboxylate transporter
MPLAFGSILGGMTTLIGTPPNLIVSGFRQQTGAGTFAMFDFTPVGLAVAAAGLVFIVLLGWRLVPARKRSDSESFDTGAYLTEARVPKESKAAGKTLLEIEAELEEAEAQVVGLVRNDVRVTAPSPSRIVRGGDILIIEADVKALADILSRLGLKLEEDRRAAAQGKDNEEGEGEDGDAGRRGHEPALRRTEGAAAMPAGDAGTANEREKAPPSDEIVLMELAVLPGSPLVGRSARELQLRSRYGLNLLAISRQGQRAMARLRSLTFAAGDLLLMQGPPESLAEFSSNASCVPLAERALRIPDRRQAVLASLVMGAAIAGAAFGLLPAAISFAGGVLASMALRTVPPRAVYEAVDWPVVVLLAALMPVAAAMAATGSADLIARFLLERVAQGHVIVALALVMVVTMTLSDLMNNAAIAAVMCPIAIGTAQQLGVSADPFLMAVAIGAACAFLTPIGHQNNALVMGPGGYRFGDYWRLGAPLTALCASWLVLAA